MLVLRELIHNDPKIVEQKFKFVSPVSFSVLLYDVSIKFMVLRKSLFVVALCNVYLFTNRSSETEDLKYGF